MTLILKRALRQHDTHGLRPARPMPARPVTGLNPCRMHAALMNTDARLMAARAYIANHPEEFEVGVAMEPADD